MLVFEWMQRNTCILVKINLLATQLQADVASIFEFDSCMKKAIIDLGTNTFHLLVSAGRKVLLEERRAVRIGMGGINSNTITADAEARAEACLKEYARLARLHGAEHIRAIGTSAFRNAANGVEVAFRLEAATGIPIRIISGEEEASLIWEGIRSGMDLGDQKNLLVDIGGGSVEFILADRHRIFWKKSIETGGQRLLERFTPDDPILPEQVKRIDDHLKDELKPLAEPLARYAPSDIIGSSGSFDTISEIHCHRTGLLYLPGPETPVTMSSLISICDELIGKSRSDRMVIPGMIELRVDMIVVASILIRRVLAMHPFRQVRVSGYSLKEGIRATWN